MGISREQAQDCFASDDLIGIGMEADAVRRALHPEGVVSYEISREIDVAEALGRNDFDAVQQRVRETVEQGGTAVLLRGGAGHGLKIDRFERLLTGLRGKFPEVWLHCFSATEIMAIADFSGLTLEDTLTRLRDAGMGSISGRDAGILDDLVRRKMTRMTCRAADWLRLHKVAHLLGVRTTASMRFGMGEETEHRTKHLEAIREVQAETGGFTSFTPRSAQAGQAAGSGRNWEEATSVEYLKTLAISRMVLDNVANVQASWETQGLKVVQMALRFGANDVGTAAMERSPAGASQGTTEEELRRIIRDAGFRPAQRDAVYGVLYLN